MDISEKMRASCIERRPHQRRQSWQKKTEKQRGGRRRRGLLLILPSLSPRPPLHRLFPPPPPLPFLLHSILSRLPLFPVQRNAARATILEQRWHEMEVGRPLSADGRYRRLQGGWQTEGRMGAGQQDRSTAASLPWPQSTTGGAAQPERSSRTVSERLLPRTATTGAQTENEAAGTN